MNFLKYSCRIVEHADGEDDTMQPYQRFQPQLRSTTQRRGSNTKASFRLFQPDDLQMHPVVPRRLRSVLACLSLIDDGQCDRFSGDMRHVLRQRTDLRTFLRIGSSDLYGKQMPHCIDGTMDLAVSSRHNRHALRFRSATAVCVDRK